ncbi:hypothetical protein HD598_002143 [Neomicrococcus aestuarii]|uniref:DUF7448 domain-containing protein n=1 Tax=Neomicrococcus aestuarii TaxID=556325 RepID=A0A7W8WZJ6_9MICC|nr:hypothetical protein [Neomicrococcus aestuarii]MBB5513456.1 hypothetical protein [Neomicrococcus aestuarii]
MSERIYDLGEQDLASLLIGKTITEINEETREITLSDRTVLQLEDVQDCCAYFDGILKKIDLTENAITAVQYKNLGEDEYDEHWELTVLSVDKAVCAIEIDGNSTSGYYCHSIALIIKKPTEES